MYSVERLLKGGGAKEGAQATVDRPVDHLVACHDRIEERLQTLERAAASLDSRPEEARQALEAVFRYFDTSGALHTEDEERSVFPRMEARLGAAERAYVEGLERQHREAEEIYERLKQAPAAGADSSAYRELVSRFVALYRSHIASENSDLAGLCRRLLDDTDLAAISQEMRARRGWLQR